MTTQTLTLTDFLLARIAEDEAAAKAVPPPLFRHDAFSVRFSTWESDHSREDADFVDRHDPARVLAECEAKRLVLARHPLRATLRALATAYADHPDYREEWKL